MHSPDLDNRTDFAAHPQMLLDRDGEKLATIVKATFELSSGESLELPPLERRRGLRVADIPWEKDKPESVAYPADICLRKPATDVIVVAKAHAPGGRPVPTFDVRVEVGHVSKSLAIFGRRFWLERGSGLTEPSPIAELELRYDYAWGGRDDEDPQHFVEEPRNPVGSGVTRNPAALTHRSAPHIEDPAHPITSVRTSPPPAGVGVVGRAWEPRRRYAGTYDQAWQEYRAPLLPENFDDRFNQCASPGLIAATPLRGGEPVRLLNLTPGGGALVFHLPRVAPEIEFRIEGRDPAVIKPHLDTVLVDLFALLPGQRAVVEMMWRASVPAPRRMKDARVVVRDRKAVS